VLLSTAYCPPLAWFALAAKEMTLSPDRVVPSMVRLEACENYQKQSYRNRCYIAGPRGVEMLQFPVVHGPERRITEIRVDYKTPWLLQTERAVDTAYHTSAYYDYYRDGFFAVLERRPERLFDLNLSLIRFFLEKTGIACELQPTTEYTPPAGDPDDWRERIHPKRPDTVLRDLGLDRPYFQVFSDKYGFRENLSIMDLLFNEGPDSILYLKRLQ
jgi:hypothetical protein